MSDFENLWDWALTRGTFQQEKLELNHIYDLMMKCNCESYLEVGAAEGNSLYILGNASRKVSYIDYDEDHTRVHRNEAIDKLGKPVKAYHGDSTNPRTHPRDKRYDCVLIDGGHDYSTVLSDCIMYASLANKYVFFHDIQMAEVSRAVEWFFKGRNIGNYSRFINSRNFGFGILEIKHVI